MICKQFNMIGLPERAPKPREDGLTLMLDKGLATRCVEDILDVSVDYIDLVKLGWGTAVITPDLHRKLAIYREAGIPVFRSADRATRLLARYVAAREAALGLHR